MILLRLIFIFLFLVLVGCGGIDFVHGNKINLTNPIYNKTLVQFSGKEISSAYRYISAYIGKNKDPMYTLEIEISEEKTKRSIQSNQAVSRMDYQLEFTYELKDNLSGCLLYEKNIFSKFSYVPKSSGYNFGSDESLDKMYELITEKNIEQFINFISGTNLNSCINEN